MKHKKAPSERQRIIFYACQINTIMDDLAKKLGPETFDDVAMVLIRSLARSVVQYDEENRKKVNNLFQKASSNLVSKDELELTKNIAKE